VTIHFLVGASGYGKSAFAYQTMQQYLDDDGYALWIPAFLIEKHFSLKALVSGN
jgi:hypothetical protein